MTVEENYCWARPLSDRRWDIERIFTTFPNLVKRDILKKTGEFIRLASNKATAHWPRNSWRNPELLILGRSKLGNYRPLVVDQVLSRSKVYATPGTTYFV